MGDHRASIKIEMEFHGIKDKADMWINYDPYYCSTCNVDRRIVEFIQSVYNRGIEKYEEAQRKYNEEQNKKRIEAEERSTLERLEKKYRTPTPPQERG